MRSSCQTFPFVSPLHVLVGKSAPASPADWQSFSSEKNVDFNIVPFALFMPRVSAVFHQREPPVTHHDHNGWNFFAFKTLPETTLQQRGERRVKVKAFKRSVATASFGVNHGCHCNSTNQPCLSNCYLHSACGRFHPKEKK